MVYMLPKMDFKMCIAIGPRALVSSMRRDISTALYITGDPIGGLSPLWIDIHDLG